jgi:hypothetical protein
MMFHNLILFANGNTRSANHAIQQPIEPKQRLYRGDRRRRRMPTRIDMVANGVFDARE